MPLFYLSKRIFYGAIKEIIVIINKQNNAVISVLCGNFKGSNKKSYIEDITRWREDMNFMFEWQEQYLRSERSERVRYCSFLENIKFISSSQRVMFFLLYGETNSTKAKGGNRDVIEQYDTHKGDIWKIRHSGPG